ncbi:carbamoyltransferase C-terminal domain-containing protein [Streptomyces sp. NPDC002838]|uniref:carbamoyltransferase family protein n=1 Tax=Streptomyces sp. NPDC002838 TaxID=3154436 RepID=UPI00332A4699
MSSEPVVLGLNATYHESSCCVVIGGELRAFAEEERFNRVKHAKPAHVDTVDRLPTSAIAYSLATAGVRWSDVTHVAYSFDPGLRQPLLDEPATAGSWGTAEGEKIFLEGLRRTPDLLGELAGFDLADRFHWVSHELAHAASTFYPSGFADAAIISLDGIGEHSTGLLAHGVGSRIEKIDEFHYPNSLGFLWEKFSKFVGLGEYDAPKLMALAAFSEPSWFAEAFTKFLRRADGRFEVSLDVLRFRDEDYSELEKFFGPRHRPGDLVDTRDAQVAAALQAATEATLVELAESLKATTGSESLCLAGGVALNCIANGRLAAAGTFENIFVQPLAHDGGTALGAALHVAHTQCGVTERYEMTTPYLGPAFSEEEITQALNDAELTFERLASPAVTVAGLVAAGYVGGWFQGAAEVGPRALGNRSILGDPRRPGTRELINLRIKHREYFRPFAPSVLDEFADDWFDVSGRSRSQQYMSFAFPVRPEKRPMVPAILHVDGTSRLQRVSAEMNPRYHALITEFHRLTGVPLVLNTSFNTYDEPMVLSPADAVRTYLRTGMDFLAIGDFLVSRAPVGSPPSTRGTAEVG